MKNSGWNLQLRRHLPAQEWAWVSQALQQDQNVWNNLVASPLGRFALAALPAQDSAWSPAQLALLDNPELLPVTRWQDASWSVIDEPVKSEALDCYNALREVQSACPLATYGLAAVHLRQKRCDDGSWSFLAAEMNDAQLSQESWMSLCACLYGMLPDRTDFLNSLSVHRPDYALHAILSNPQPPDAMQALLIEWAGSQTPGSQTGILQLLTRWRPALAKQVSASLTESMPEACDRSDENPPVQYLLDRLNELYHRIQIDQTADQAQNTIADLESAKSIAREIQACLSADQAAIYNRLAQSQLGNETAESTSEFSTQASLETWELARQLAPMRGDILSGYAIALVDAGNAAPALDLIQPQIKTNHPDSEQEASPALLTAAALAHSGLNDLDNAKAFAKLALRASQQKPSQARYLSRLADLLLLVNEPALAIQAAELSEAQEGASPHTLAVHCQSSLLVEKYDPAIDSALKIITIQPSTDAQALLIHTLETAELWEEALAELVDLHQKLEVVTADDYHQLAECAIEARDVEQAAQACHAALQINPEDSRAYLQLGKIAIEVGDHPAATHHLQQAIQLNQNCAESWILYASELNVLGENERALEVLRTGSLAASDDARMHLALGKALLDRDYLAEALGPLRKAQAIAFDEPAPHAPAQLASPRSRRRLQQETSLALGRSLYELGQADEACQVYEMLDDLSIDKSREHPELLHGYAKSLMATGKADAALPFLDGTLQLQPDNSLACLDTARALMITAPSSQTPEASYQRVIRLLGQILPPLEQDSSNSRVAVTSPVTDLPADLLPEGYALLAEALQATGDYSAAELAYRVAMKSELIEQAEWRYRLASGMGEVAMRLGQPETALAALLEATLLMPAEPQLYRQLSEAYQSLELGEEAYNAALKSVELDAGNVDTLTWYASQCQELEALTPNNAHQLARAATQALQQAVKLAPQDGRLRVLLGQTLARTGDREAAIETFSILAGESSRLSKATPDAPDADDMAIAEAEIHITCDDFRAAAQTLLDLDEAARAIDLYSQALQLVETGSQVDSSQTVNLLSELAHAHRLAGALTNAIETIDKAIALDPSNVELFTDKAALLLDTDDRSQAMECLMKAAGASPNDRLIQLQLALVAQALGDQPLGYQSAVKAAQLPVGGISSDIAALAVWIASEMALAMQQVELALETLENNPAHAYEGACLLAELALEAGLDESSAKALTQVGEYAPHHPRSLAIQSRFIARQDGLNENSNELLHNALQNRDFLQSPEARPDRTQDTQFKSAWYPLELDRLAAAAGMRSLSMAALEHGRWKPAMALADSACQYAPLLPSSHFLASEVVIVRAENQRLCQHLAIITHAPGEAAVSDEAEERLTNALQNIQQIITGWSSQDTLDVNPLDFNIIKKVIDRWLARGQAVFHPGEQSSSALMQTMDAACQNPQEITALVMCQLESGDPRAAWRSAQNHLQYSNVALAAGLALAALEPTRGRDLARQSIERLGKPEWRLVDAGPRFHALLAKTLCQNAQRAEEIQQALAAWEVAAGMWNNEPRWHSQAARQYIRLFEMQVDEQKSLQSATNHLQIAVEDEPGNPELFLELGKTYLRAGDSVRAIQALEQVTRLAPQTGDAWLLLANVQMDNGILDKAIDSADQAVEYSSQPVDALLLRAKLSLETNNPRGAYNRAQSALTINPRHPRALYLLALAAQALNQPAEALSAIDQALELPDPALEMFILKIQILRQVRGPQIAIQAAQQLAETFPNEPAVLAALAALLQENGRGEEATKAARAALQYNQGELTVSQEAYLNSLIGEQMRHAGQLDQAIHHLSEAIRKSPTDIGAYIELGRSYQDRRQVAQAMEVYQRAAKVAPNDYRPYYQAGLAYKESRDYMEAETMLRRAAHLAPNDVSIHRQLAAVVALNLVHNHRLAPSD